MSSNLPERHEPHWLFSSGRTTKLFALHQLPQLARRDDLRLVSDTVCGRMYPIPWQRNNIFDIALPVLLMEVDISLENRDKNGFSLILAFSVSIVCGSDLILPERRFLKQWRTDWPKFNGNFPSLLKRNYHTFENTKLTYRSCDKLFDPVIWQRRKIYVEKMWTAGKMHWMSHSCNFSWGSRSSNTNE